MSKIMVVEDDTSLREIYSIRITAEGYEVVTAGDGEEALAVAVREKPDLILSDVMMPKISGFDMLDILRSTPETANIKVIMMTALSAEDQRQRGERLGANRYLVKSQVGIEDVINAIHEVMNDKTPAAPASTTPSPTPVRPTFARADMPPTRPSMPATSAPATPASQPAGDMSSPQSSPTNNTPSVTPSTSITSATEPSPQVNHEQPVNPAQ